ncbi:leucine-rich repeat-containing protein [Anaeramoeba ignava]|uniref:Leucine-rich repeat-containing protein n=1 Tax=Anaeramoeba ignava TaxID=1746090 RepID=A0A9Q0LG51_ANAIG|nr:leucine-rich repeat-containing protein [Anaeramoeba ignava]
MNQNNNINNIINIIKEGSIYRIFKKQKNHQYLILTSQNLLYFKHQQKKQKKNIILQVNLQDIEFIKQNKNDFQISVKGTEITTRTKNISECQEWISKILIAISNYDNTNLSKNNQYKKNYLRNQCSNYYPSIISTISEKSKNSEQFSSSQKLKNFFHSRILQNLEKQFLKFDFENTSNIEFIVKYQAFMLSQEQNLIENQMQEKQLEKIHQSKLLFKENSENPKTKENNKSKLLKKIKKKVIQAKKKPQKSKFKFSQKYNGLEELPELLPSFSIFDTLTFNKTHLGKMLPIIYTFTNLQKLVIIDCGIDHIPVEFLEFPCLKHLDLSQNPIRKIPCPQNKNVTMRILILNNCKITEIPDQISRLIILENLFAINNLIVKISPKINQLENLKRLDLSYNMIKDLPTDLSGLKNSLNFLSLASNLIEEFPSSIKQLYNLQYLNLCQNLIEDLSQMQNANFTNLEFLDLHRNFISHFPSFLSSFKNISEINLEWNFIDDFSVVIYSSFPKLTKLLVENNIEIDLKNDHETNLKNNIEFNLKNDLVIKIIDSIIKKCLFGKFSGNANIENQSNDSFIDDSFILANFKQNDKKLSLNGNNLTKIDKIDFSKIPFNMNIQNVKIKNFPHILHIESNILKFANITSLSLTNCEVSKIPEFLCKLTNLSSLNLSHNPIIYISSHIKNLSKLEFINLSHCRISRIDSTIFSLFQLKILDLSNNFLSKIPKFMAQLSNLELLDLSHNQIRKFPRILFELNYLYSLNLEHNRIEEFPHIHKINNTINCLNLSHNFISNISLKIFYAIPSLKQIKISNNLITSIIDDLVLENYHFSNLIELDFSYNLLKNFPFNFFLFLDSSCIVRFIGNPLNEELISIVQDLKQRKKFFQFYKNFQIKKKRKEIGLF